MRAAVLSAIDDKHGPPSIRDGGRNTRIAGNRNTRIDSRRNTRIADSRRNTHMDDSRP